MADGFLMALSENEIKTVEDKIGYVFKDKRLLSKAFTHSSFINENKGAVSNERLEFLGDRVLNLICAEELFFNNAGDEGRLSELLKNRVSSAPLKKTVSDLGLIDLLKTSSGLNLNQGENKAVSDLFEAIIAAIYIDSGQLELCRKFVKEHLQKINIHDYISLFKEWCEKNKKQFEKSVEKTQKTDGVNFVCKIGLDGQEFCGEGRKIKDAEKNACQRACDFFGIK